MVGSSRQRESGINTNSPKIPVPQYQPIDRTKRKGKIVENYSIVFPALFPHYSFHIIIMWKEWMITVWPEG